MAERSNAAVLKTVEAKVSGGSNPSLSASTRRSFSEGGLFLSVGFGGRSPQHFVPARGQLFCSLFEEK
jgi:hypothetical protein